jgi:hypothetical protein
MKRVCVTVAVLSVFTGFCFGQSVTTGLEAAINRAAVTLIDDLPNQSTIAVLSVSARNRDDAVFVVDELEYQIVDSHKFKVADRKTLDAIRSEQNFQMSGDVDDNSAVDIGRMLGASVVITGSITGSGTTERLTLKALDVKTAQIVTMAREALSGTGGSTRRTTSTSPAGKPVKKTPAYQGNFEIIQGKQIPAPIDMAKFAPSAKTAITVLRYTIDQENEGFIIFTIGHAPGWWAQIKLCYWDDEYWYEYVDSRNLKADPERNRIHGVYPQTIEQVERQLYTAYYGGKK